MKRYASQFGPPPWTWAIRWRYLKLVTLEVFWRADTTVVRGLMAVGSIFCGAGLMLPLQTFERAPFKAMAMVADAKVWGCLLLVHAAGVIWRIYDTTNRPGLGFAINAFGIGIWMFSTCLIYYAVGEYSPFTGMELAIILAAFVALMRTGINDEVVPP